MDLPLIAFIACMATLSARAPTISARSIS